MNVIDWLTLRLLGWTIVEEKGDFCVVKRGTRMELRSQALTVYSADDARSLYTGSYWDYLLPPAAMYPNPRVLMVGLGGGTVAKQLSTIFQGVSIDVVESNPDVADLYRKHFLKNNPVNLVIADGAAYIASCKKSYDVIILDAFVGLRIPRQFLKDSFVGGAALLLAKDGTMVINFIGPGSEMRSYLRLLKTRFNVYRINPPLLNNSILVCAKQLTRDDIASRMSKRMGGDVRQQALARAYARMKEV